jgi:hypothetical protein
MASLWSGFQSGFLLCSSKMSGLHICRTILNAENGVDWLELMVRYHSSRASDPRDHIYRLPGLAHPRQVESVVIDYGGTT